MQVHTFDRVIGSYTDKVIVVIMFIIDGEQYLHMMKQGSKTVNIHGMAVVLYWEIHCRGVHVHSVLTRI